MVLRILRTPVFLWLAAFCLLCIFPLSVVAHSEKRILSQLSSSELTTLARVNATKNLDPYAPSSHLAKILIPRPPNTANNTFVRTHIISTLRALKWDIEEDSFTGTTPYGLAKFTNVIATKDPDAPRKLVLAAHFDSKFFPTFPENQFVGATDSAVPCAMLLDLAETLNSLLDRRAARFESGEDDEDDNEAAETTLQLIFFDGEEAYKDWSPTDSVYGARHLAEKWDTTYLPPHPGRRTRPGSTILSTIDHLVLLDLLGAPNPLIRSYFLSTAWLFDALISAEARLGQSGAFDEPGQAWNTRGGFFIPRTGYDNQQRFMGIEDDHTPFLQRGVQILHLITEPFPRVWHTLADDATALDLPTMKRWNLIFRVFVAEYLGLRPDVSPPPQSRDEL